MDSLKLSLAVAMEASPLPVPKQVDVEAELEVLETLDKEVEAIDEPPPVLSDGAAISLRW